MEGGELIGVLALVAFYILSAIGGNKKKRPRQRPPPPRPRPREAGEGKVALPSPRPRAEAPSAPASRPRVEPAPPPEREVARQPVRRGTPMPALEEQRAELLRQAEAYLDRPRATSVTGDKIGAEPIAPAHVGRRRIHASLGDARQGIIWQAILGPPKALE